jgi:hypothetical protein
MSLGVITTRLNSKMKLELPLTFFQPTFICEHQQPPYEPSDSLERTKSCRFNNLLSLGEEKRDGYSSFSQELVDLMISVVAVSNLWLNLSSHSARGRTSQE